MLKKKITTITILNKVERDTTLSTKLYFYILILVL